MDTKYQPLTEHLKSVDSAKKEITLTFRQMEALLGFALPKSAADYRQWWGNQKDATGRPQAYAWTNAGFEVASVQPKKPGGWVRFKRI